METTATQDGDEWVLNGTKKWVTNGPIADYSVVMAKTTQGAGHQGISVFLVPLDRDGVDIEPITNMMGLHTAEVATVEFDGVRIPEQNLIGEEDQGFYQLMYNFSAFTRLLAVGQAVGVAQAALDAAKKYAREREQFGQAIGDFQAVSHKLAEMRTDTEAARQLFYSSAQHIEDNDKPDKAVVSMAKLFGSETAMDVVDKAMQIHGGNGYLTDYQVERYYRDARIIRIYEGSNEIQKEIISDSAF
jgi:alkylation response protein AidB-like acyl-CoA dehydrogenase